MNPKLQVAVVGATGVVGREIVGALQEHDLPPERLTLLATDRSAGEEVEYSDSSLMVERATAESFRGMGLVLMAVPPDVSRALAPAAQSAGAWVVDVSDAYRKSFEVPMVLPGVNDVLLERAFSGRIVTIPSVVTSAVAWALEPLRKAMGVKQAHLTALMGASTLGQRGIDALENQTSGLLSGREPEEPFFPQRLGFNVIPHVGDLPGDTSGEESGWTVQLERLWNERPLVGGTAMWVPTFYGVMVSVSVQLGRRTSLEEVRASWRESKLLKVLDAPAEKVYPMPMLVTADPTVHVGRLHALPSTGGDWVTFVAAVDNAGRGAAVTAVEVGDLLTRRDD